MQLYAIRINNLVCYQTLNQYLNILQEDLQYHILSKKNHMEYKRSLFGYLLTYYALKKVYKLKYRNIYIKKNNQGKPFIEKKNIFFSISHSGEWVVVGLNNCPVGIDVEKIEPKEIEKISKYFSDDERCLIKRANSTRKRQEIFYNIWVIKESYSKVKGVGLSKEILSTNIQTQNDKYIFQNFCLDTNYKFAYCTLKHNDKTKDYITIFKEEDFLSRL
jgi:4'-phosphopantetheinyl transferase